MSGLLAVVCECRYLNESEDPDEVKDSVDRLLGDTDWDDLDDEELDRRYKEYVALPRSHVDVRAVLGWHSTI